MVAEELIVSLSGGAPWGFRLQGGAEQRKPLQVAKVRKRSKACRAGLREADELLAINELSCEDLSHAQAMNLIDSGRGTLHLRVRRSPGLQSLLFLDPSPSSHMDESYRAALEAFSPPLPSIHIRGSGDGGGGRGAGCITSPPDSEAYYGETDSDADVAAQAERQRRQKRRSPSSSPAKPSHEEEETSEMSGYESAPDYQAMAQHRWSDHQGTAQPQQPYPHQQHQPYQPQPHQQSVLPGVARREVVYQPPAGEWGAPAEISTENSGQSSPQDGPGTGEGDSGFQEPPVTLPPPLVSPERAREALMLPSRRQLVPMVGPLDAPLDEELTASYKDKARQAKLHRGESVQDKQVKEARTKCRTIASLLTDAPNPHAKGVLMFKKRRQRAKRYTLTCFGSQDDSSFSRSETEDEEEEGSSFPGSESELDEEAFAASTEPDPVWDSGYLDLLDKRSSACFGGGLVEDSTPGSGPGLNDMSGKGAQLFEQQRQRVAKPASSAPLSHMSDEQLADMAVDGAITNLHHPPSHPHMTPPASLAAGAALNSGMMNGDSTVVSRTSVVLSSPGQTAPSTPMPGSGHDAMDSQGGAGVHNRTAKPFAAGCVTHRASTAPVVFRPTPARKAVSVANMPVAFSTSSNPEVKRAVSSTSLYIPARPATVSGPPSAGGMSPFSPKTSMASFPSTSPHPGPLSPPAPPTFSHTSSQHPPFPPSRPTMTYTNPAHSNMAHPNTAAPSFPPQAAPTALYSPPQQGSPYHPQPTSSAPPPVPPKPHTQAGSTFHPNHAQTMPLSPPHQSTATPLLPQPPQNMPISPPHPPTAAPPPPPLHKVPMSPHQATAAPFPPHAPQSMPLSPPLQSVPAHFPQHPPQNMPLSAQHQPTIPRPPPQNMPLSPQHQPTIPPPPPQSMPLSPPHPPTAAPLIPPSTITMTVSQPPPPTSMPTPPAPTMSVPPPPPPPPPPGPPMSMATMQPVHTFPTNPPPTPTPKVSFNPYVSVSASPQPPGVPASPQPGEMQDSMSSREQRISVPASRTGILQDSRKRSNRKPMFSTPEEKKGLSPNPALLSMVQYLDDRPRGGDPGFESGPEEDFLNLGAEACNFMQAQRGGRQLPPPVAPKPRSSMPPTPAPSLQAGGKGADLFARRQSRMDRYVVDKHQSAAPPMSPALTREPSPTPSLSSNWKYSSNIRAPPPINYNPLLSPSCPPVAQRAPRASEAPRVAPKPSGTKSQDFLNHQPYQLNSSLFTYGGGAPQTPYQHQQGSSLTAPRQVPVKAARVYEIKRFSTPTPMSAPTSLTPKVIMPRSATTLAEPIWRQEVASPPPGPPPAPQFQSTVSAAPMAAPYSQASQSMVQPGSRVSLPALPRLSTAPLQSPSPAPAPALGPQPYGSQLQAGKLFKSAPELSPRAVNSSMRPSSTQPLRVPRPRFSTSSVGLQPNVWRPGGPMIH